MQAILVGFVFLGVILVSGIFGIVDTRRAAELTPRLEDMSRSMRHYEWYVTEYQEVENNLVGLGRVGIGIFNPAAQPVWNQAHTVALTMAGEIYRAADLGRPPGVTDEEWALALYEAYGERFAEKLNGAFVIAVWDIRTQKLTIANDRFGLYHLYYAHYLGRLVFAPETKAILRDADFVRKPDMAALAQYMRFQQVLGSRTFFESISLLPGASIMTFDGRTGQLELQTYWTYDQIPYNPQITFDEAVEEGGRLLRQSVRRLSEDRYRPGVFLSGGLDGRTIIGLTQRRPIVSLTFGAKGSRDVHYAEKIAQRVGSQHHWVDLPDGKWVLEYVDAHLKLTEGYHNWLHLHGMSMLPLARQLIDVNLTGWDGGSVMGHPDMIQLEFIDPISDEAMLASSFRMYNKLVSWPGLDEVEEQLLYTDPVAKQLRGLAFDSFCDEIRPFLSFRRDVRHEYFFFPQHCTRSTQNMVIFGRSHVEFRFPYFDYDVFDFMYSMPAMLRKDRQFFRAVIKKEAPRLALIPYDHDLLPPTTDGLTRNFAIWNLRIRGAVNRRLLPIFPERPTLYADYENYLRTDLRSWAENILYSAQLEQRGLFRPSFVRTLMERHLSGREEWTIGKIAPIITYEMMLRRFYD